MSDGSGGRKSPGGAARGAHPAPDFAQHEVLLDVGVAEDARVLLGAADQVRHDLVEGAVREVPGGRAAGGGGRVSSSSSSSSRKSIITEGTSWVAREAGDSLVLLEPR